MFFSLHLRKRIFSSFPRQSKQHKFSTKIANENYALKDHTAELNRLRIQHNVWSGRCRELYKRGKILYGDTVLDVGCGPGYNTLDLSEIVGKCGKVYALDSSLKSLSFLKQRASQQGWKKCENSPLYLLTHEDVSDIELIHANIEEPLPPSTIFEVNHIFVRWVLTWIRDPNNVLKHLKAAYGSAGGGNIIIWDYFSESTFELHSEVPTPMFDKLLKVLLAEWKKNGDPSIGKSLPQMLVNNAFKIESMEPNAPTIKSKSADWIWPTTYFDTQIKRLNRDGVFSDLEVESFKAEWDGISDYETTWYSPPMMVEIVASTL
jgi:SAM-dependent methyltransferase